MKEERKLLVLRTQEPKTNRNSRKQGILQICLPWNRYSIQFSSFENGEETEDLKKPKRRNIRIHTNQREEKQIDILTPDQMKTFPKNNNLQVDKDL